MTQLLITNHPKKKGGREHVKEFDKSKDKQVLIRAHKRTVRYREYLFVCSGCEEMVERETYAALCPSFGMRCGGKAKNCRRNKTVKAKLENFDNDNFLN